MGQEDASNDHNLKPQDSDDEDSDFPEFEFPVGDCVDVDVSVLTVRAEESTEIVNGDDSLSRVLVRAPVNESPKKMPYAIRSDEQAASALQDRVTVSLSEESSQPEISKHVVAEESKLPSTLQASQALQRKVLQSNPSFKSLVTILTEPLEFSGSNMESKNRESNDEVGEGREMGVENEKVPTTPRSKRFSGILSRVNAKTASQRDPAKIPERQGPVSSTLSVNALVEKFSTGVRNKIREEAARALSPNPSPRNFTCPRRTIADRSRSIVPRHLQEQPNPVPTTPRTISSPRRNSSATDRSLSPLPCSWKDSGYSNIPKDRWPDLSKPDAETPQPRFLTPTRAAALKAVKPPAMPTNNSLKSLQFTSTLRITTPVKQPEPPRKTHKDTSTKGDGHGHGHPRTTPTVTEPAGFNFRTDERAERRKEFYSKLEERLKEKDAERKRAEARAQEEKESQLQELRKSLTYKANPVPRFYQEPAPAPAEIRRIAPTRPKAPNFTAPRRRDSCPGGTVGETSGSSSRTSPLRSRLLRCASLESNSGHSSKLVPKSKQPFRPV